MAHGIDLEPDTAMEEALANTKSADSKLVDWVMGHCTSWRDDRNSKHQARWEEYYRLWRGIWAAEDKTRNSERSRLITPALQQAIESVTSEIESAVLDKPTFFDIVDDDTEGGDIMATRTQLQKDMEWADYQQALNEIFLMGSIFGTGIGKIDPREVDRVTLNQTMAGAEAATEPRTQCKLVPILPSAFLIDPAATSIAEAMGCAHEYSTPRHEVVAMQNSGVYRGDDIAVAGQPVDPVLSDEQASPLQSQSVNLIDYQGLVPRELLDAVQPIQADEEVIDLFPGKEDDEDYAPEPLDEDDLVEAFIVIGNEGTLLKAKANPSLMQERNFVAYRHEIVPAQFWGRGVAEKGYNSQKALDASMRARIDGLALTVHPMIAIDGGKMPRGFKFSVRPGKSITTNGNPSDILQPFKFGTMDPNVFTDNAELERMVTMSTGGMDTAAPVKANNRNETASGMSMQLGGMVKRSKRTIRNIERELIIPLIEKTHRIYMLLEPAIYPANDVTFKVTSVLGTMARELEQQQFSSMLNTVDSGSPAFWMLMKSVYSTSSLSNREEMLPMIDQNLKASMQPPAPDPMLELKQAEIQGKIRAESARIQVEYIRAQAEIARAANDARTAESEEAKNESQAILNLAKAEAEELGSQMNVYKAQLEKLERDSVSERGLAEDAIRRATAVTAGGTGSPA